MPYFQKRYHPPGTAPGTLIAAPSREPKSIPARLSVIEYTETELEECDDINLADYCFHLKKPAITWIHIQGHPDMHTLRILAELFGLHSLALEDVINTGQRPKLEHYEEHCFLTLGLPDFNDLKLQIEQVSLFLGVGYVLSFHAGEQDPFELIRGRLRTRTNRIRKRKADYLFYALVDRVIDQGFPVLESFGDRITDLEMELLDHPDRETLHQIHQNKRDLALLRRLFWPQRELIYLLLQEEYSSLIQEETKLYFRDCHDHSIQILDLLETYRDMTAGMLDVYLSSISHRLNEIIRLLTVISTIFIPLTFVAGVYGMNFGRDIPKSPLAMPELDWYYGYPLFWLVIVGIAVGMVAYFKCKRWF